LLSVAIFTLIVLGVGIRAYRDLSRPEAWSYWKELYFSPSLTSALIAKVDVDGPGNGRPALAISGKIGSASASWFRDRLGEAHLAVGDLVLLSSPGGDVNQALIMGEIIRSRGLMTAVGVADSAGRVKPSYCASACVLVYTGGSPRIGITSSVLGVHRFVTLGQRKHRPRGGDTAPSRRGAELHDEDGRLARAGGSHVGDQPGALA
jgi:hypothetical protein